jgi:leucine dehydrogenase
MAVFDTQDFDNHERVLFCRDRTNGLNAIIAIHNTALGPAAGGCRMWPYKHETEAISDVLRLSRGMSYKNAMAGLPLGGGKAVIIGNPLTDKSENLLKAFGKYVNLLGGEYITAEDIGICIDDLEVLATETRHVSGLSPKPGHAGGDPSPKTAYGVYLAILAAVAFRTGEQNQDNLKGIKVAVQGLGAVGYHLCNYLHKSGANLLVSDINITHVHRICDEFNATPVDVDQILFQDVDVLAPCAMGAVLNQETIPKIKASIISGGANNQLATSSDGDTLLKRNILYAPDYVVNAGGIINVAYEHLDLGDENDVFNQIQKIGPRLTAIFQMAREEKLPPNVIADRLVYQRLKKQMDIIAHAA